MSYLRSRVTRGAVLGAVAASAALGATAVPAVAGPTVTIKYLCRYPLVEEQPLKIVIYNDIPSTATVGRATNYFRIVANATAGGTTVTGLNLVGATSVEGVSNAGAWFASPDGNLPVSVPIGVDKYTLPAGQTSGELNLTARGATPALTFTRPGTTTIKLDSLALNLIARKADGTPVTGLSQAQTIPATDNDPNTFDVSCRLDPAAGTQSTRIGTIQVFANPDTTAPTKPGTPVAGAISPKSVALSWAASTDAVGVTGYDIYDGTDRVYSTTGATSTTIWNLGSNQSHSFTVKAKDNAGNVSTSAALTVSTPAETAPTGTPNATPQSPINVTYACQYPLVGTQTLPIKITTNIPTSAYTGTSLPAFNIGSLATVNTSTYDALKLVGAASIEGSAKATSRVSAPNFTLPVTVPITVPKTSVPATRQAFTLNATGQTPPLAFPQPGTAKIVVDSIKLNLTAKRANGTVIQLPSIGTDSDGNPNTFDVSCALSPVTQFGLIGVLGLIKKPAAAAAKSQAGV